jgi:hypothetical protein
MLVLMALVTTFMTSPIVRWLLRPAESRASAAELAETAEDL